MQNNYDDNQSAVSTIHPSIYPHPTIQPSNQLKRTVETLSFRFGGAVGGLSVAHSLADSLTPPTPAVVDRTEGSAMIVSHHRLHPKGC